MGKPALLRNTMKSIDLGMSYDMPPSGALPSAMKQEEHYPSLNYDGPQKLDIPEEGVMKIRYRKTRSEERKMGDHEMHSCTIEALEILDVEAMKAETEDDMPAKSHDDAGAALDRLMEEKMGSKREY